MLQDAVRFVVYFTVSLPSARESGADRALGQRAICAGNDYRSSSSRFSRSVAQLQRFDGRAWATMVRGDHIRKSSRKCRIAVVHAATCSTERTSMRLLYSLAAAMLVTVLLPVLHASAFTSDPTSGTNSDGSPRFVDPDDQIHSLFSTGSGLNEDGWSDRNSVPRNALPAPDGTNQGVTFPSWFFPTSPRW